MRPQVWSYGGGALVLRANGEQLFLDDLSTAARFLEWERSQ